jgi:predicted DNA-binding transcriptional regulator YafY
MYDEVDTDGRRRHTVAEIATEFGVSRPTIYRYLDSGDLNTGPINKTRNSTLLVR